MLFLLYSRHIFSPIHEQIVWNISFLAEQSNIEALQWTIKVKAGLPSSGKLLLWKRVNKNERVSLNKNASNLFLVRTNACRSGRSSSDVQQIFCTAAHQWSIIHKQTNKQINKQIVNIKKNKKNYKCKTNHHQMCTKSSILLLIDGQ